MVSLVQFALWSCSTHMMASIQSPCICKSNTIYLPVKHFLAVYSYSWVFLLFFVYSFQSTIDWICSAACWTCLLTCKKISIKIKYSAHKFISFVFQLFVPGLSKVFLDSLHFRMFFLTCFIYMLKVFCQVFFGLAFFLYTGDN